MARARARANLEEVLRRDISQPQNVTWGMTALLCGTEHSQMHRDGRSRGLPSAGGGRPAGGGGG